MILRFLAGVLVVLGCGYIGMALASRIDVRIHQLEALEGMLNQLAFNIGFLSAPLPEAIRRTAESQQGIIRRLLHQTAAQMQTEPNLGMGKAWVVAIRECADGLCLEREELEALEEFAQNIGQGDSTSAMQNIQLTTAKLKLAAEQAREKRKKDGKLCRGMGFLAGILIVLLLM